MIVTTKDMYLYFLDNIKREDTSVVKPVLFNRLINEAQLSVVMAMAEHAQLTQRQDDGLAPIHPSPVVISPTGPENTFQLPTGYLRLMGVQFKLNYDSVKSQECGYTGISDWLSAKFLYSDMRSVINKNPYRKPKDSRLYYTLHEDRVILITGGSKGHSMMLDYLRYPRKIFFDELNQYDSTTEPPNPGYIAGLGSVNSELNVNIRHKIVEEAVRMHLERIKDPRYQSFIQEQMLRPQEK